MNSIPRLTKRERDVAELLLQGKSNQQIALALGIQETTVESHLTHLYAKLGGNSRVEAILILRESPDKFGLNLGKSPIDKKGKSINNQDGALQQKFAALGIGVQMTSQKLGKSLNRYKIPTTIGILLAIVLLILLLMFNAPEESVPSVAPTVWESFERECEYPDESSVGQMIWRSNASGSKVHGQFGTSPSDPWPAQSGSVTYKNISLPQTDQLYLRLRYSKNSPAIAPILIYLDNEQDPRASISLVDLQNWDQFTWSDPIFLREVSGGTHSIKLYTVGQQYGVADLDKIILTKTPP
jgi:DNA-binding CsgD family transcriptional regulator